MEHKDILNNRLTDKLTDQLWQGTCHSHAVYGSGDIYMYLPNLIDFKQPYRTDIHIYDKGFFSTHRVIPTNVFMIPINNNNTSNTSNTNNTNNTTNTDKTNDLNYHIKLVPIDSRKIEFKTTSVELDEIQGTYLSNSPCDYGTFILFKSDLDWIPVFPNINITSCQLL